MAGLREFFKTEQKRKRKLFKGEGYPESAAARAKDKADRDKTKDRDTTTSIKPSPKKAKFGVGSSKTIMHNGRSMVNVTGDQLKKTGLSQTAYMRRWKELGKRPTTAVKPNATTAVDDEKARRLRAKKLLAPTGGADEEIKAQRRQGLANMTASRKRVAGASGPPKRGFLSPPQRLGKNTGTSQAIDKYLGPTAGGRAATVAGLAAGAGAGAGAVKGITTLANKLRRIRTMAEVKAFLKGNITKGEFLGGETFKKGGVVKAAKKSAAKKSAARKTSSKKSIDGIARKGKTRAKHR